MKRKYYRKCGDCGCRHEQSEMVRTRFSDNGWLCKERWARLEDADDAAFHPEWCAEEW